MRYYSAILAPCDLEAEKANVLDAYQGNRTVVNDYYDVQAIECLVNWVLADLPLNDFFTENPTKTERRLIGILKTAPKTDKEWEEFDTAKILPSPYLVDGLNERWLRAMFELHYEIAVTAYRNHVGSL